MVEPQVVLHVEESKMLTQLCDVLRFRTKDQAAHSGVQPISPNYQVVGARRCIAEGRFDPFSVVVHGGDPDAEAIIDVVARAKALALGATAVGLGRGYLYALAIGGVDGLVSQLRAVLAELDLLMAVDGFPSIADLRAAGAQRI